MEDRVAIFIDGSNLYHALRSNFRRYAINFAKFANKLCGSRRLFRTYGKSKLSTEQCPNNHDKMKRREIDRHSNPSCLFFLTFGSHVIVQEVISGNEIHMFLGVQT